MLYLICMVFLYFSLKNYATEVWDLFTLFLYGMVYTQTWLKAKIQYNPNNVFILFWEIISISILFIFLLILILMSLSITEYFISKIQLGDRRA